MKIFILTIFLFAPVAVAKDSVCKCTCVVKSEEGKYETETGIAKTREIAGQKLKKTLGSRKCEITPVCEGNCTLD